MPKERPGPVVAGVDFSTGSEAALAYAVWEARRRGLPLRLVQGFMVPAPCASPMAPFYDDEALIDLAEERLAQIAADVQAKYSGLEVTTKVVSGSGAMTLVAESASASLVVVGSRGQGGFGGLLLGSVAEQVSTHARCPAIVVRQSGQAVNDLPGTGRVLVGIDGSAASADALGFAFDEAASRAVPLIAVHVWSVPQMTGLSVGTVWSRSPMIAQAQLQEAADRVLAEAMAGWPEKYPTVEVKRRTVHGDEPAHTLLDVSAEVEADLIVVGSRGHGGLVGRMLGSVGHTLVAHAQASVAVIHPERSGY